MGNGKYHYKSTLHDVDYIVFIVGIMLNVLTGLLLKGFVGC